jgi:hypothetical protein
MKGSEGEDFDLLMNAENYTVCTKIMAFLDMMLYSVSEGYQSTKSDHIISHRIIIFIFIAARTSNLIRTNSLLTTVMMINMIISLSLWNGYKKKCHSGTTQYCCDPRIMGIHKTTMSETKFL